MRAVLLATTLAACAASEQELDRTRTNADQAADRARDAALAHAITDHRLATPTETRVDFLDETRPSDDPFVEVWRGERPWSFGGEPPAAPPTASPVSSRARGLRAGEQLFATGAGALIFATTDAICVEGDACGCRALSEYRTFVSADGRPVIARLRPVPWHVTLRVESGCMTGCGMPHVEDTGEHAKRDGIALGTFAPEPLQIVDVPYAREIVDEVCDDPRFAP